MHKQIMLEKKNKETGTHWRITRGVNDMDTYYLENRGGEDHVFSIQDKGNIGEITHAFSCQIGYKGCRPIIK